MDQIMAQRIRIKKVIMQDASLIERLIEVSMANPEIRIHIPGDQGTGHQPPRTTRSISQGTYTC